MAKLLLLSVVIAMVALPVLLARDSHRQRGLGRLLLLIITFNVLYLLAVRYIYPHLQ